MTKREIAALACKILAVYTVIGSLSSLVPTLFQIITVSGFWSSSPMPPVGLAVGWPMILLLVLSWIVHGLAGVLLWVFANPLGVAMVGCNTDAPLQTNATARDLHAIAFSVIGVLTLVSAASHWSRVLVGLIGGDFSPAYPMRVTSSSLAEIVSAIVETVLGLWLLLGSRRIVGMIQAIPEAGLRPVAPPPDSGIKSAPLDTKFRCRANRVK